MSFQFNFFCTIDEMNTLLPMIQKYDAMIIGAHRFSAQPVVRSDFSSEPMLKGNYIVLRRCLNEIVWVRLKDSEHYVNSFVSPVRGGNVCMTVDDATVAVESKEFVKQ